MPTLTTVGRVKRALGIPAGVTLRDEEIGEVIDEVEGSLLGETTLTSWVAQTYSETLVTRGRDLAMLSRFPVLSIVGLTISGTPIPPEARSFGREGSIRLLGGASGAACFPWANDQVEVEYIAGIVEVAGSTPLDIRRLVTLAAARQCNLEGIAGIASAGMAPIAQTAGKPGDDAVQAEIARILAKYRTT